MFAFFQIEGLKSKLRKDGTLTKEDLIFLYEIENEVESEEKELLQEITIYRDKRLDLAKALGCQEIEISLFREEALTGGIKYHYGSLDLSSLASAEGLRLPEQIGSGLCLNGLTSAEGLKLPEQIGGNFYLRSLPSEELTKNKIPTGLNCELQLRDYNGSVADLQEK